MDASFRDKLTKEVLRIGDRLLEEAIEDSHGIHWLTLDSDGKMNTIQVVSETIYQGVSGIVLFLAELYRFSSDHKYLDCVLKGCQWLIWNAAQNPTDNYAFYTGRMGTAFTLAKISEISDDLQYLNAALTMTENCSSSLIRKNLSDDIMSGTSGTLLGLIHLYQISKKDWILEKIREFNSFLVNRIHFGPVGFYWERLPHNIRGLAGFGHGASGIAFVFLEMGHYFKNEVCYEIAQQAFEYEDLFFNAEKKNWPDFRKGIFSEDDRILHQKEYLEGNIEFFNTPKFMNAWCHGAAGIGLTRARAALLFTNQTKSVDVAVERVIETNVVSDLVNKTFTLCHGGGGNAEILIRKNEEAACIIANKALMQKEELGYYLSGYGKEEDKSLFLGNAGIGYFFLRLLDKNTPSIMAASLNNHTIENSEDINISFFQVNERNANKLFGRTLHCIKTLYIDPWNTFNSAHQRILSKDEILNFVLKVCEKVPVNLFEIVYEIFNLELKKIKMNEQIISWSYLNIQNIMEGTKAMVALKENDEVFLRTHFQLAKDSKLIKSSWDWSDLQHIDPLKKVSSLFFFLKPHFSGILELKLVLPMIEPEVIFSGTKSGHEIIQLMQQHAPQPSQEHVVTFLKNLVKYGVLTIGEK